MLSRCAFEGMQIPFEICEAARVCRGAARCAPGPHDLRIRECFASIAKSRRANRFAAKSVSPGQAGAQHAAPPHVQAIGEIVVATRMQQRRLWQRIRRLEDEARWYFVVGGETGGFAVAQLAQISELALHDFFVSRTQELLFEGYEVHAFVHG